MRMESNRSAAGEMAMVGSRVQAMQDEDGNTVAVKTDVMVDPQSGLLVERKTVVAEVFSESGQHKAVLVGQQTNVAAVVRNSLQLLYRCLFLFSPCVEDSSTEVSKSM